jgi:hypothetical protein
MTKHRGTETQRFFRFVFLCASVSLWFVGMNTVPAHAQQMPDPSQIHGKAIPAAELPAGTVTVRVVREAIGNNISGQSVKVTVGGMTKTATTDEQGRAQFENVPRGEQARAEATVDGESLVSDPFMVPTAGGLRVILVAGIAQAAERKKAEEAKELAAPPTKGVVVIGGNSRILMQFQDDNLQVFYVLDVVNSARTRVDIGGPLMFDLPRGAAGSSSLEGSSPTVKVSGGRVTVLGPFAPGSTAVQVGYQLRYDSPDITFEQKFPVAVEQVTVGVQKAGDMRMTSPQFQKTDELRTQEGTIFLVGNGPTLAAGTPLAVNLAGLPIHSRTPVYAALALAGAIVAVGVWLVVATRGNDARARQTLERRRDSLLGELEQLEVKRRAGTINADRYSSRRQKLLSELEAIYGELDEAGAGPTGGGEGIAA